MHFGIHTGQQRCSYDDMRQAWKMADDGGMDWVSVWDHLFPALVEDPGGSEMEAIALMGALVHAFGDGGLLGVAAVSLAVLALAAQILVIRVFWKRSVKKRIAFQAINGSPPNQLTDIRVVPLILCSAHLATAS